ncbi:unnamed protein product, partial [Brenthis ino]
MGIIFSWSCNNIFQIGLCCTSTNNNTAVNSTWARMAGGAWKRSASRVRTLRLLLRDTARALQDVQEILTVDSDVPQIVQEITSQCCRPTALVILGSSPSARARLLNCILGRNLLPEFLPKGCRWIRIQYGVSTQVHLTVGNSEFELVEELECNRQPWDTLPLQDVLRQETDLGTTLEIELNNSFLKDGLKIIVPPDISESESGNYVSLKRLHSELYSKKSAILQNFTPIYLFALNKYGRNIFGDKISKVTSSSEFWSTLDLYKEREGDENERRDKDGNDDWKESCEPPVISSENCLDLHQIKEIDANSQVLFILFSNSEMQKSPQPFSSDATESTELCHTEELPESDQGLKNDLRGNVSTEQKGNRRRQEEQIAFMNELLDQWELITSPPQKHHVKSQWSIVDDVQILKDSERDTEHKKKKDTDSDRTVKSRSVLLNIVLKFATECSQSYLLDQCKRLSEIHNKLLQQFILASFDMARELQIVPKKIQYVARQEQQLYETMNEKFSQGEKKRELLQIMQEVLEEMRSEINNMDWSVDDLPCHQDKRFSMSNSIFYSTRSSPTISLSLNQNVDSNDSDPDDVEEAESYESYNFDDYEIIHSNEESMTNSDGFEPLTSKTTPLLDSTNIPIENETELYSLSVARSAGGCSRTVSSRQASLDVQRTVLSKLSRKISLKLVKFVDCLKDSYFGTLQRCLESLEGSCRRELGGRPASEAVRQLLSVARHVDLTPCAECSLLADLLDSLRRLFYRLRLSRGAAGACCALAPAWRRRAALAAAHSLSPPRLARLISLQILERLGTAHERYQSALGALEAALAGRLHHTEDVKLAIRKKYAPAFARLCLESTSMCDLLMYGTPELGREIGRGQYGVVYAARGAWGGRRAAAVKSVLPADERHYHELAMEFFYTRSIPPHPRIVRLLGSLVQRSGGGGAPGVLLVSERRARDLHAAVRLGLSRARRMQVACDIVEGIRYLHSLGLVHRDIKLKNVLLDEQDRAALSDLGFCAAAALVSGSLVGTPVHMAPELLAGRYHAAVDVYAFGILFWYLCAGHIKLPSAFETFQNKEQLWSKVKKGLRPERLPQFSDECWEVMESCWASEPSQRALLGDIQPKLERILEKTLREDKGQVAFERNDLSDDSLDMTGLYDGKNL